MSPFFYQGSRSAQVVSVAALVLVLFVAAFALRSCGRQPGLSNDDIRTVTFTNFSSGTSWPASEAEVRALVEHYSRARNLSDDFGTTPPARIDVLLKSGETLVISGGGETFQTVRKGEKQYNIESPGLHRMLQEVATVGDAGTGGWEIVRVTENELNDMVPWLADDRLAWRAYDGNDTEIMVADLATGSVVQITDNDDPDYEPRMSGDYLVWQDGPTEKWRLHATNLLTGERWDLAPITWYGTYRIAGDFVVWSDYSSGPPVVKVHHFPSGETRTVTVDRASGEWSELWPTTDGRFVGIYASGESNSDDRGGAVYLYDWEEESLNVLPSAPGLTWGSWMENNWVDAGRVVWSGREGDDLEIFMYDAASGSVTTLTDNELDNFAPVIGGSSVLWYQAEDAHEGGYGQAGEADPSGDRTVRVLDLETGEERELEGAFAWLQADGGLAVTASWPQRWDEMYIYDLGTGSVHRVAEDGYVGSWIHVAENRVTWYREKKVADVATADVMLAYRGQPPRLPYDLLTR